MSGLRQCPLCLEDYDETIRIPRILPKCKAKIFNSSHKTGRNIVVSFIYLFACCFFILLFLNKGMHSMCSQCLPKLYKNPMYVECPTCRQVNQVRIAEVPKNRDILEFLEYLKSQTGPGSASNASAQTSAGHRAEPSTSHVFEAKPSTRHTTEVHIPVQISSNTHYSNQNMPTQKHE